MTGEHYKEPYAALNPNRMVPMLEDGDFRLTESSAILKYLADKIDSPAYPKDLKQRAKVNEMMDWLNTDFYRDGATGSCYPQIFPHHKRRSDEAQPARSSGARSVEELAEAPRRSLDRAEEPVPLRQRDHHRGLFRRRPRLARRTASAAISRPTRTSSAGSAT